MQSHSVGNGDCVSKIRRRFDPHRFYHDLKYHIIEIAGIVSMLIVLWKLLNHEW
jgi:hypothetical protein